MTHRMKLILGTMNFGPQVNTEESLAMVQSFREAGYHELDSAYVYNDGETERILGSVLKDLADKDLVLATKVNPRVTGRLDAEAVRMQLEESLCRLNRPSVDTLYLHFPDPNTPLENPLEECAELHRRGLFSELGLSNFSASQVVDIWNQCHERGWPKPTVYQGMYNGLSRKVEDELFPALRDLGMRFYAYNPLAGGLLSGKYSSFSDEPEPGRFTIRPNYRDRYWKETFFEAINLLTEKCREVEIGLPEAAYRWLAFHSSLSESEGDGIIVGASKMRQLEQNLAAAEKGPLPEPVVSAFTAAWERVRSESPDYFRYSSK